MNQNVPCHQILCLQLVIFTTISLIRFILLAWWSTGMQADVERMCIFWSISSIKYTAKTSHSQILHMIEQVENLIINEMNLVFTRKNYKNLPDVIDFHKIAKKNFASGIRINLVFRKMSSIRRKRYCSDGKTSSSMKTITIR